jgi:hypothetical protein
MLGAVLIILAAAPCPGAGTALIVETGAHRLTLCEAGAAHSTHRVAIGSGGVAKKRVGWAQTPLGIFTLAAPRPSAQFHTFIPLVNPDPKRFSAWAIGLHGPPRATKDEGDVNIDTDWTWGCIALRSDERIDEVAAWVREKKVTRVEFRE